MFFSEIVFANGVKEYCNLLSKSKLIAEIVRVFFKSNFNSNKIFLSLPGDKIGCDIIETKSDYIIISNGNFFSRICHRQTESILKQNASDIITITADPKLKSYEETAKLTSDGKIAGFYRNFNNSALEGLYQDKINYVIIKTDTFMKLFDKNKSLSFDYIYDECKQSRYEIKSFSVGGTCEKLNSVEDFYRIFNIHFNDIYKNINNRYKKTNLNSNGGILADPTSKIEKNTTIFGPTIICENSKLENCVIDNSVIGPEIEISEGKFIKKQIILENKIDDPQIDNNYILEPTHQYSCKGHRQWRVFDYPVLGKRIFDIIFSTIMIIIFGPIWLIVTLAIKINSPGPVFFKAIRQGLKGKEFKCLKFRSMRTDAPGLQKTLRIKNEVDGPQFKIADDPRISSVGSFLRDTSLDEIPQFFNVLFGQMSIVGPRPSPEVENMKCPYWRDARLSVKPGITGLWQIMRTREASKDFQEWVYFDTKYVREVSFKKDIWICYKTAVMLIKEFVDRF